MQSSMSTLSIYIIYERKTIELNKIYKYLRFWLSPFLVSDNISQSNMDYKNKVYTLKNK